MSTPEYREGKLREEIASLNAQLVEAQNDAKRYLWIMHNVKLTDDEAMLSAAPTCKKED